MKKIYIDPLDFTCHTSNTDGSFSEVTLSESAREFFSNKCTEFIEGYRLKPEGKTWIREDGEVFTDGELISPWKDYNELDAAQRKYEHELLADAENALAILLGGEV